MNKVILYLGFILVLLSGCVKDEKDLFSDPSSIRIQKTLDECKEVLISSGEGWYMEYFPNTSQYGGYIMFMNFQEDGTVNVSAENSLSSTSESSLYSFKKDNGPVLSFDTYNSILHMFAEPGSDGRGYEGDFEFVIESVTNNYVILRGKKWGDLSFLSQIPSNLSQSEYLEKLESISSFVFPSNLYINWELNVGNDILYLQGNDRFFVSSLSNEFEEVNYVGAIPTVSGIHFNPPLEINGEKYEYFNLAADKNSLVSVENKDVKIVGGNPILYLQEEYNWLGSRSWTFDAENLGGVFDSAYKEIVANCLEVYKEEFAALFLKYQGGRSSRTLSFKSGNYEGSFDIEAYTSFTNEDEFIFIDKGTSDRNAQLYKQNIKGFDEFISTLCTGSFRVESYSELMTTELKLTSTVNSDNWFKLILK